MKGLTVLKVFTYHVMLAAVHDILRSQRKQHNVQEEHSQHQHENEKQQSLWHGLAGTYFIELSTVSQGQS